MNADFVRRLAGYHLTENDFWAMVEKQNGSCAICQETLNVGAHIDHDHEFGFVRGVLCLKCNMALGLLGEQPGRIMRAADYLLKFTDWHTPDAAQGLQK